MISLRQRTLETNAGLVNMIEKKDKTYAPNIQMVINGRFKTMGFTESLPHGTQPLSDTRVTDNFQYFDYKFPAPLAGWERTGYELGKGFLKLQEDVHTANKYREYLGGSINSEVRSAAPSIAKVAAELSNKGLPESPSPFQTQVNGTLPSVHNTLGADVVDEHYPRQVHAQLSSKPAKELRPIRYMETEVTPAYSNEHRFDEDVPATVQNMHRDPETAPSGTFARRNLSRPPPIQTRNLNPRPIHIAAGRQDYENLKNKEYGIFSDDFWTDVNKINESDLALREYREVNPNSSGKGSRTGFRVNTPKTPDTPKSVHNPYPNSANLKDELQYHRMIANVRNVGVTDDDVNMEEYTPVKSKNRKGKGRSNR